MPTWSIVLLVILVVLVIALVVLYFWSKRMAKRQEAQQAEVKKQAQPMSFFVIDKKKLRLKDAGLPKVVYDNTPRMGRITKMPIVKVKVANRVMNMMCDGEVYKTLLPNQEVKAMVAGLYIVSAKRIRGPVYEPAKNKKKTEKLLDKLR